MKIKPTTLVILLLVGVLLWTGFDWMMGEISAQVTESVNTMFV